MTNTTPTAANGLRRARRGSEMEVVDKKMLVYRLGPIQSSWPLLSDRREVRSSVLPAPHNLNEPKSLNQGLHRLPRDCIYEFTAGFSGSPLNTADRSGS